MYVLLCDIDNWSQALHPLVLQAQHAGPGSQEQRQLYSLLASLLKLCVQVNSTTQEAAHDRQHMIGIVDMGLMQCRHSAAAAAAVLLLDSMAGSTGPAAAGALQQSCLHVEQQQQPDSPSPVVQQLPSLVMFGRVCLQWAQELQVQLQHPSSRQCKQQEREEAFLPCRSVAAGSLHFSSTYRHLPMPVPLLTAPTS
jgi:hypothetical protein